MCGRATLSTPEQELRKLFKLREIPLLNPRFNIAPSEDLAVVREPHKLELVRWGLSTVGKTRGVNVRAESVARAPQYRESFRRRRCLVLVDGFYEWQRRSGRGKQPFLVHRADGKAFALAGIWRDDECAIITGPAEGVVKELHDRMPIVIRPDGYERWLNHDEWPTDLLGPNADDLVAHAVSQLVNSPKNDDPRLVEPVPDQPENLDARALAGHD